jgi:hypothetical protein
MGRLHSPPTHRDIEMIDYISATKHLLYKDTPFFGHCTLEARYSSGWERYRLQGCERLNVWHNPSTASLKLEGSIMYYWQGHNFTYSKRDFVSAIRYIETILQIGLWDAMVETFEYGAIIEVQSKPKDYITHHTPAPKEGLIMSYKPKDKGSFRWYEDNTLRLKMYDAGRNILHKQGLQRRSIIEESGWNPEGEYLKWEAHYLRPEILNHGLGVRLADLVNPNWENVFKEDLYLQYKRLVPMRSIIIPTNKKELSTADIFAIQLVEDCINEGKTIQEVRKMLYARINSISDEILSKADKDSRKRQIKTLLEKIKEEPESKWDLSSKLEAALNVE